MARKKLPVWAASSAVSDDVMVGEMCKMSLENSTPARDTLAKSERGRRECTSRRALRSRAYLTCQTCVFECFGQKEIWQVRAPLLSQLAESGQSFSALLRELPAATFGALLWIAIGAGYAGGNPVA